MTAPVVLAHISVGELSGGVAALGALLGGLWRTTRRIVHAVEVNLEAIAANTAENKALAAQVKELAVTQERINREGSEPMREVLRQLRVDVTPKLGRIETKITNGEARP